MDYNIIYKCDKCGWYSATKIPDIYQEYFKGIIEQLFDKEKYIKKNCIRCHNKKHFSDKEFVLMEMNDLVLLLKDKNNYTI